MRDAPIILIATVGVLMIAIGVGTLIWMLNEQAALIQDLVDRLDDTRAETQITNHHTSNN